MYEKFDDIRPYNELEIAPAMRRIAASEQLASMARFVFPGKSLDEVKEMLKSYTSVNDFQLGVMYEFNEQVIKNTVTDFTYAGIDRIDPQKNYLFVSNHRDIVLDSSLLQQILHKNGFRTTEITFGSNLMSSELLIDIGRSNKMFKVARGENPREFYKTSLRLSEYIRHVITEKGESVWIAQRNGRTKNGDDVTDQGIVKMFCMSGGKDLPHAVDELNIVSVAVSYQWEPCDLFKVRELYKSREGKYIKEKNEDFISVLTGILQPKGKVNITFCEPLRKEELTMLAAGKTSNEFYKEVASLIDRRIYAEYILFNNNYIAYDLRTKTDRYKDFYSIQEKDAFQQRLEHILSEVEGDKEALTSIFLDIYANPVAKR